MNENSRTAFDHLLIGAPTLEEGIDWLEQKTGVRAARGGVHPGLGTWNAVASLGPRQYVELIAPDPDQKGIETLYVPGLRDFESPRVATWAVNGRDLLHRFGAGLSPRLTCPPLRPGSRVRPDGSRLAWTLAFPRCRDHGHFDGALPFFIEWEAQSPHPGALAPAGLALAGLSIGHPEPGALREALTAMGVEVAVHYRDSISFEVELETPRGRVLL